MPLDSVTLEQALQLLQLPRVVGVDPANGEEIVARNGRYGPYIQRGSDSRSLESEEQLLEIGLEEALALFAQPKQRRFGPGRRRPGQAGRRRTRRPASRSCSGRAGSGRTSPTGRSTPRCGGATTPSSSPSSVPPSCSRTSGRPGPPPGAGRRRRPGRRRPRRRRRQRRRRERSPQGRRRWPGRPPGVPRRRPVRRRRPAPRRRRARRGRRAKKAAGGPASAGAASRGRRANAEQPPAGGVGRRRPSPSLPRWPHAGGSSSSKEERPRASRPRPPLLAERLGAVPPGSRGARRSGRRSGRSCSSRGSARSRREPSSCSWWRPGPSTWPR